MTDKAALAQSLGAGWPYLIVILAAFLPSEIWRWAAVFLSRGLSDQDERIVWVRTVAASLLTCVVVKLLLVPTGALTHVPLGLRLGALFAGVGVSLAFQRSVFVAILVGEAVLVGASLFIT